MDRIRDRGNIKWSSMMLVEHKDMLKQLADEQHHVEPPHHDDEGLEVISRHVMMSWKLKKEIRLIYWHNCRHHEIRGLVTGVDPVRGLIRIQAGQTKKHIPYTVVVRSEIEEEF